MRKLGLFPQAEKKPACKPKPYDLDDFAKQLAIHNRRSNNFPMRPLGWLSTSEFTVQYV